MAWNGDVCARPMKSLADFSSNQYRLVELATTEVNAVTHTTTGNAYGVLLNQPKLNEHATVAVEGEVQCFVGSGGCSIGDWITSGVSGWATKVVSGGFSPPMMIMGRALSTAASGMLFTLDLDPQRLFSNSGAIGA